MMKTGLRGGQGNVRGLSCSEIRTSDSDHRSESKIICACVDQLETTEEDIWTFTTVQVAAASPRQKHFCV